MAGDSSKKKKKQLPENLEQQRTHVFCGPEMNSHTRTSTSANMYMPLGVDNSWNFDEFKEEFSITINKNDGETMEFDIVGIDPAIANALRRILIAEVPTVAIEHVFVINNTSIIQDEVLAHRLGLVPLNIDPREFDFKAAEEAPSEKNTVVFKMDITCRRDKTNRMVNDKVMSSDLHWLPMGSEMPDETSCRFASGQDSLFSKPPAPVHKDILLAMMRPGQTIQLEAHCIKGIGKEHAKWSPVATAWYRLLPEVILLQEVTGDDARHLAKEMPNLFWVEGEGKQAVARVGNAREHEMQLEKIRRLCEDEYWAERVQLRKKKNHFIFTIESSGVLPPDVLLCEALGILAAKADRLAKTL